MRYVANIEHFEISCKKRLMFLEIILNNKMKKDFIFIILCILSYTTNAQIMHQYNTNFTISLNNFVDSIPIEIENDQVYIPIAISGKTYRFNLDTGSSQGLIYEGSKVPIIHELGNIVSQDANNISDTVKVVQIADFQLGEVRLINSNKQQ